MNLHLWVHTPAMFAPKSTLTHAPAMFAPKSQWGNAYRKSKGKSQSMAGRGDFEKKKWRKCKNVTWRCVFEQQK